MPASFSIIILPILIGVLGFLTWPRSKENLSAQDHFEDAFLAFLAGLAILAIVLFFAALFAVFSLPVIGAMLFVLIVLLRSRLFPPFLAIEKKSWAFCLSAMIGLVLLVAFLAKPFDPTLISSDASVYMAASANLANSGGLESYDQLVGEMTHAERRMFFANRFPKDATGPYARFPGGVKLLDPESNRVTFHFHHLWVAWLAFGKIISAHSPQFLLSFFAAVSFASLFFLGNLFGKRLVGLSIGLVHFFSFPQLYYSRMATSELASQAFFLAGLLLFVKAMQAGGRDKQRFVNLQILGGVLWGCFSLCRVDGIIFLFACLAFVFLLIKEMRSSFGQWIFLFITLSFFTALALLHQLAGFSYQGVLNDFPLIGKGLPILAEFILYREMLLVVLLIGLGLAVFGWMKFHKQGGAGLGSKVFGGIVLVAFSLLWVLFFGGKLSLAQISQQFNWLLLYLPVWLWAVWGGGVLSFSFLLNKDKQRHKVFMVLLIFCLVPMCSYLTAPMVTLSQPWAVRRFVPMVLPLFSAILILTCHLWLKSFSSRFGVRVERFIVVAAALIVVPQTAQALFLWQKPLYAAVEDQVSMIAEGLPEKAIILVPDSEAGSHLQTALQYSWGRSALMMPLAKPGDEDFERRMRQYVWRQLQKDKPVVLLFKQQHLVFPSLAANFRLVFLGSWPISFSYIPQTGLGSFPGKIKEIEDQYYAFIVEPQESAAISPGSYQVDIGKIEEDLQFIGNGLLGPEKERAVNGGRFRWTGGRAEFFIPFSVREVSFNIHQWGQLSLEELGLVVEINGTKVNSKYQPGPNKDRLIIPVSADLVERGKSSVLTIDCHTFSMASLGLGEDSRDLGLALDGLTFQY